MTDVRVPVNIEAAVIAYLSPLMSGWRISTLRPVDTDWQQDNVQIIRVTASGGPGVRDWVIDDSILTVEVWNWDAERSAAKVAGLLNAWPEADTRILDVSAGRPINFPDPLTNHPRYTLPTVQISARAELLV